MGHPVPGAETREDQFRAKLALLRAPQPQGKQLWQQLLEEEEALATCLEEVGWPRPEAPGHIAQLYQHLSKHAHNEFQLSSSLRRVDILVSATDSAREPGRRTGRQKRSGTCTHV